MKKLTLAIIASMCMMLQGNTLSPASAYNPVKRTLFIWTNKGECDVTISIYNTPSIPPLIVKWI